MTKHPFKIGTKLAKAFTILSDGEWHCGKHDLPGTQPAKAIQIIRQHGFEIKNISQYCIKCKDRTVHRKLISTTPTSDSFVRLQIPSKLRQRVLKYYNNIEAITFRQLLPTQLEVDHRFPQVRWARDEKYDEDMSDEELDKKFQLLTRQNNLWKSRYCEHCAKTGERGTFIGINFFYESVSSWDLRYSNDDERGCRGCFWYDPGKWRKELNVLLQRKEKVK